MITKGAKPKVLLVCILLAFATVATFWPVGKCDFIIFDDPNYVTTNERVTDGLSWHGVVWAFRAKEASNWHPITWLSHMVDVTCFGLNPAGHHWTNVAFHAANGILLFLLLRSMTGGFWRSAFVAALFALHPLRVESVVWVSERKDVLSTFFGLLTLLAYARYVQCEKSRAANAGKSSSRFPFRVSIPYCLAVLFFALGLMSKPMLVTWPFLMLLLDGWPFGRLSKPQRERKSAAIRALMEKVPFLVLALASCITTFFVQQDAMNDFPLALRIQNALVAYTLYLQKMIWPSGLAVFYPYPNAISSMAVICSVIALLSFSFAAIYFWRKRPYLLMGWCWFLGMLIPVIGIVQVGRQSMADRYSYVPLVGIFIALVWLIEETTRPWRNRYGVLISASVTALVACAVLTWMQIGIWKNSEVLFRHALAVTQNNALAHMDLGCALLAREQTLEAKVHFEEALRIWPDYTDAAGNLGVVQMSLGETDDAIRLFTLVTKSKPNVAKPHFLLGNALNTRGNRDEAIVHFRRALEIDPNFSWALNDLAWILATDPDPLHRNGNEAVKSAEQACRLKKFKDPLFIGTLAAAYAEANRFDDAIKTGEKARELALAQKNNKLAERNLQLIEEYRAHQPHRENPVPPQSRSK